MEKEPHETDDPVKWPDPTPFEPDPDLITHLEGGNKPTRDEVRAVTEPRT